MGLPENVVDGETGLVVPVADVGRIAAALRTLALDPGLRDRFGKAGRRRARLHFDEAGQLDAYVSMYETILRAAPGVETPTPKRR
jgi:glycosyltransferase involved in cell wall biosynthesis